MISVSPVLLCGGVGTRLWPLSRAGFPKQFLCLTGNESLFQQSAKRVHALGSDPYLVRSSYVVCNEEHRYLVMEQLREVGLDTSGVLLEPVGRNTAPALTLAAFAAMENDDDPILVVVPADQDVKDSAAFRTSMHRAIQQAASGAIVMLGITPDRPETGYGYIRTVGQAEEASSARAVLEFVEKPNLETARRYLAEGGYAWNSGMFVLKASVWLQALGDDRPDILAAARAAWNKRSHDRLFVRPGGVQFAAIPSESVDYAVIESSPGRRPIFMVALDAGWNDLGAWDAVWNVAQKNDQGNVVIGDALLVDARNALVHTTGRLVGLLGLDNVVVVETPDAVLVADKSRSQDVKAIVNALQTSGREEHSLHRKVLRPWGWYDSIDEGERFKVKRIMVKPKASLSLQKHHHRAEHWIVVSGIAEITCGHRTVRLSENQSTYIPLGETHRLANPGTMPLEIIEVQSGGYLGEDDIVRFEDFYGRATKS